MQQRLRQFFFPTITIWFLIRVCLVALFAYVFFGYLCTPFVIRGSSMEPTYRDGGFNFCWKPGAFFFKPRRHQVVVVRLAGERVMLLKRVVALEGEEVSFRQGRLFVNDEEVVETYLRYPCNWDLPPRRVDGGHVYLAGDNRGMAMEDHAFGQTHVNRIAGSPLW